MQSCTMPLYLATRMRLNQGTEIYQTNGITIWNNHGVEKCHRFGLEYEYQNYCSHNLEIHATQFLYKRPHDTLRIINWDMHDTDVVEDLFCCIVVLVSICSKFAKSRHVVQRCISTLSPGSSLFGSIREIHVLWVQKTDHIWLECQDKNTRWLWNFVTRFSNWPWNIPWTTPMSQLLSKKRPILT